MHGHPRKHSLFGCNDAAYSFPFQGPPDICSNELFAKSVFYCAAVYCSDVEIRHGLHEARRECDEEDLYLPDFENVVLPVDLSTIQRVSLAGTKNLKKGLNHPVMPDRRFFDVARHTVVNS